MHHISCKLSITAAVCLLLTAGCTNHSPPDNKEIGQAIVKPEGKEVMPRIMTALDADGNGLYDDAERRSLLAFIQSACPEITGEFDADGDGAVTVEEQTAGRHPLSMLARGVLASEDKIPWSIDVFPEWVMSGYLQDDIALGPVPVHAARGTIRSPGEQATAELQPQKVSAHGGISFAADSGQHLVLPGQRDARWNYRWCIFTFRIDGASGSGDTTVLLDLNRGDTSNKSSPKIWYTRGIGLRVQYVGQNAQGLDRRVMTTDAVVADGESWNVLVCGIRYGRLFASVNGVTLSSAEPQPDHFSGDWPRDAMTYLGDERAENMAWAYDALIFGLTEPSEAMVRKMSGWAAHRLRFQDRLPADHPYRNTRPIVDAEDFPHRYVHDDGAWTAWGASLEKTTTRQNAGGERVEPSGFERVFYDDFRAYRIGSSMGGDADLWAGPGFNPAVGADAPLIAPGATPDAYPYDAAKKLQTLSLVPEGKRWRGSAFYSVNDLGHGYTWSGPKVFRIRCMFPQSSQSELAGGLFPAFWSYGPDFLFWRTANRIECDWFEFDGQNGWWYNGIATHYHYAHVNNIFALNPKSYKRYKVYSGELKEEKSGIPGGLFIWDGQFHTWEFVVDRDWTYVNVTIPDGHGGDRWVEICRAPTAPTFLERLDLQLDYALKAKHGTPSTRQDFVVDFVEVLQRSDDIAALPGVYRARPTISGEARIGGTLRCDPALDGVSDVRYYWFADGYPLTYGSSPTWTVTEAQAGADIRCMIKAVGARDMPEAWTVPVTIHAPGHD